MALILITGGVHSGKSAWAQRHAQELASHGNNAVLFIATNDARDMATRLRNANHRKTRPRTWKTVEAPRNIAAQLLQKGRVENGAIVILDCVAHLVYNVMTDQKTPVTEPERIETLVQSELRSVYRIVRERKGSLLIVSTEVGLGSTLENDAPNTFRDVVGKINQWIATEADSVWLTVSGMALPLHALATPVTLLHG